MPFYEAQPYTLAVQTASVTVANTTTETTLVGTVVGSVTIPASLLAAGRVIRVSARGYLSTKAAPVGTLTLRVRLGGVAGTLVLSAVGTPVASLASRGFAVIGEITCRTAGATGTVFSQGMTLVSEGAEQGDQWEMVNTATVTIDTTVDQAVAVTAAWATADAGNTITLTNLVIEVLN